MAIRFQCPSCQQPIETDDEWGGKLVACPYCRNTVAAPLQSTLEMLSPPPPVTGESGPSIPTASAVNVGGGPSPTSPWPASPSWPAMPHRLVPSHVAPNRRGWGTAALILASATLLCAIGTLMVIRNHRMEVEALQADPGKPFLENQQHVMELMQQRYGTIPAWMLVLMGLPILGGVLWLGAIGCAIVGVRSPSGRALSLAAFALCCVSPMLCCCGPMLVATLT